MKNETPQPHKSIERINITTETVRTDIVGKTNNESEEKYRTLFNYNRDSITIFRFDSNGDPCNFIETNPATTEIFGYTKQELMSLSITDIESHDISYKVKKNRIESLKSTGKIDFETIVKNKKGHFRNVEIESLLINYLNAPAIMNITRDITERKQLEIKAKKAHENLASILEAIPDLLFEIDFNGTIHHYQSRRDDLLFTSPSDFIDKKIQDIIPNDASNIVFEAIKEASVKGWSTGHQYSLDLQKGKHWFELSISPIKESNPKNQHFIVLSRDITFRKEAEKKQTDSLNFLEKITSRSPGILYQFQLFPDGKSCFPYASEGIKQIYDLNPDDVAEDASIILKNIHPDDRRGVIFSIKESATNLTLWQCEYRAIINNTIKNLYGTASPQLEEDGSVLWYGFLTDITEKKITEESLRESEEKYRSLVENSPDAVVIYVEGKIVFINDEGVKLTKANSKNEIIGKAVLDFIHPDSIESVIQRMIEVVRDNNASDIVEEKFIDLYGTAIDAELKAIPMVYDHQDAVQVIIHDITERKRTQEKIKHLSQAVEQSPVSIIITNTFGDIEYVNPKFSETSGYTFDEIIGKNPNILKSNHTSPKEFEQLWKTLLTGDEWHGEFHNVKKDGELYWESASISPITNTQGKTTHYIAIKEDITNRKKVEQQLIKAKEKAEESDRLKLAFLANMSHEIRTPMNGILGFTELLKSPNLAGKEQQEYIQIIEKSGIRMLNIINDIISISKVESGQVEIALSETNVNEQIEYLYHFFQPEAIQKGICLSINNSLPESEAILHTDKEKIYAILTNLVKNAIKFTDSGSINFGYLKKGKYLEFFVKDTGFGISKIHKEIVFERFRQANESITRTHEGSGLGLAISKAYVEMLGGKIWLESEEGKGSSFYFTIPFVNKSKLANPIIAQKPVLISKTENEIKDLKVLIVEDDSISKLLVNIALKPFSKEILKVSTGIEAIETCRNNPDIDLVMMDINMPEMGGYEATKQIRKFNKNLVIIAQTANGMQNDKDKAIAIGCTDYISKPINIASLSKLIQKYFKK